MTVVTMPTPRLDAVTPTAPPDNTDVVVLEPLVWQTDAGDAIAGIDTHFQVQIATDAGFTNIVRDANSLYSVTGFQYEAVGLGWTALPVDGLPDAAIGSKVRYTPSGLSLGTYRWRVRQLLQV